MTTKQYDAYSDLITFTRASTGTALRHVGYGPELVTNGTFDTDSDWTKGTGWTISGGAAHLDASVPGAGVYSDLRQPGISTSAGKLYQFSADVLSLTNATAAEIRARIISYPSATTLMEIDFLATGSAQGITTAVPSGDISFTVSLVYGTNGDGDETASLDNISVKEVIFDRATDPLVLFNHPTNVPRIEYDANGNRKGLLIEEARTNLLDYSEDFTDAYWTAINAATLAIDASGPDGETSAVTFVDSGEGGDAAEVFLFKTISVSTSTTYTFSVFAKADQLSWLQLALNGFTTPANNSGGFFDLANGSLGNSTGDTLDRSITDYGNGWYRCSITFTTDVADTAGQVRIYVGESNGDRTVDLDGTSSILIYGAQLEAGSFPTSYISTAGAAASRAADVASIPTSAFGYNPDKGTVVCEFEYQYAIGGGFVRTWEIAGNNVDRINLYTSNSSGRLNFAAVENNIFQVAFNNLAEFNAFRDLNTAVAFSNNDFAAVVDGILKDTSTSGSITNPSVPRDKFSIGSNFTTGNQLNGHIKSIQYYPRRLTNAQLQELTS